MAKSKTVTAQRGAITREFEQSQWDAMKKSKQTYGWVEKSELAADVKSTEANIEASQLKKLQEENQQLRDDITDFKFEVAKKIERIEQLETRFSDFMKHDSLLDESIDDLTKSLEEVKDEATLSSILQMEVDGQNRKGAVEAINKRIGALKPATNPKP